MEKRSDEEAEERQYTLMREVGKRIRVMRERLGLARREMTDLAGVKPAYGYLIENEGQNLTLKTIAGFAFALQCSPRDLMPDPPEQTDLENENRLLREQLGRLANVLREIPPLVEPLDAFLTGKEDMTSPPKPDRRKR